jgi:integrase
VAGRPPLDIGTHGKINPRRFGDKWQARCRFRDADGETNPVSAVGHTRGEAIRNLRKALLLRSAAVSGDLTGDTRTDAVAERYLAGIRDAVKSGQRSPSTADTYQRAWDCHIKPALGALKLREITTSRVDRFLIAVRDNSGPGIAKTCRTVLSGILGYAQRNDAVTHNAVRGTTPLSGKPRKQPRALTDDEQDQLAAQLMADPVAVEKDLVDLVEYMLGVGCRIGEALAVSWDEIDLDAATVKIAFTLIRVKGQGLVRKSTKTEAGRRTLPLPTSTVELLRRRRSKARTFLRGLVRSDGEVSREAVTCGDIDDSSPEDASFAISAFFALPPCTPLFPDSLGGWRDPNNTRRDLRNARGTGDLSWLTSHTLRKTVATRLDEAGMSAREIANHLGHARPSITQDSYMGRGVTDRRAAEVLDTAPKGKKRRDTGA